MAVHRYFRLIESRLCRCSYTAPKNHLEVAPVSFHILCQTSQSELSHQSVDSLRDRPQLLVSIQRTKYCLPKMLPGLISTLQKQLGKHHIDCLNQNVKNHHGEL